MASENQIVVEIVLDDGKVVKGLIKTEKAAKKSGNRIGKAFTNVFSALGKKILSLTTLIGGLGAALLAAFGARKLIQAAARQEQAVTNLNASLRAAGGFTQQASERFQELASQLQATSKFGDEVILSQIALARNFTRTNEEAERLIKSAVDLAAASNISLDSAVKNLGKSLSGLTGELGESVSEVRSLTAEQLKAGAAIDVVGKKFAGVAAEQIKNFSGGVTALNNVFGDFLEKLGDFIIKSPVVVGLIGDLTKFFLQLGKQTDELRKSGDIFGQILIQSAIFAKGINTFVILPLEFLFKVVNTIFNSIRLGFQTLLQVIAKVLQPIGFVLTKFSNRITKGIGETLLVFSDSVQSLFIQLAKDTNKGFGDLAKPELFNNIDMNLQRLIVRMRELNSNTLLAKSGFEQLGETSTTVSDKLLEDAKKIQQAIETGLKRAIVSAAQAVGASLVKGQQAFESFKNLLLNIIGDIAIQIGSTLIAIGIGIDALKAALGTLTGGLAIVAGLALIALGGALKALGGGGIGVPTAAPGTAGGGTAPGEPGFDPGTGLTETDEQAVTRVAVNIQGNVLDRRETGLEIAEVLNEVFDQEGVTIASAV